MTFSYLAIYLLRDGFGRSVCLSLCSSLFMSRCGI